MINCFKCHKPLSFEPGEKISRREECPACGADLHSCQMCIYYDLQAYNSCRESNALRVVEKDKSNFCDYFHFGLPQAGNNSKDDLLNLADSLFKK